MKALYRVMCPEYPEGINAEQLREMLGGVSTGAVCPLLKQRELQSKYVGRRRLVPKLRGMDRVTGQQHENPRAPEHFDYTRTKRGLARIIFPRSLLRLFSLHETSKHAAALFSKIKKTCGACDILLMTAAGLTVLAIGRKKPGAWENT